MRVSYGALGAVVALNMFAASAFAADPPSTKPPVFIPPPVPPALSPFYFGAFAGGSFGGSTTQFGGKNVFCGVAIVCNGGGVALVGPVRSAPGPGGSPFGGIRVGADFAISRTVYLGGVADISAMSRSSSSIYDYSNFSFPGVYGVDRGALSSSISTNWIGTVRAKLGVSVADRVAVFGTGGLAFVHVRASVNNVYDVTDGNPASSVLPGGAVVQRGSLSDVALGYAFGGGVEYQFSRNFSLSLEYIHYSAAKSFVVTQVSGTTVSPSSFVAKVKPSGHLVRVGLDYRL